MHRRTIWLASTSLGAALLLASPAAFAAKTPPVVTKGPTGPSNGELEQRIEKLESTVQKTNEQNAALRTRLSTVEQAEADPVWSYANGRPTITSGDGRFSLSLRTRFQFDVANFFQKSNLGTGAPGQLFNVPASDRDLSSGAVIRRAYLGIEGRAFQDFWYEYRLDAGGGGTAEGSAILNLGRIAYVGIPHFRINVGVIQPIFTYGDTVSSGQLMFIERAEIDNIAVGTFGGSDARRGIELTLQNADWLTPGDNLLLSGAFTGSTTTSATGHGTAGDEPTQVLGRAAYRLWSNGRSNFQIAGSAANILHRSPTVSALSLSDRPEMRVDGTALINASIPDVDRGSMWGVDTEFNIGSFYLGGEYHRYNLTRERTPGAASATNPSAPATAHFSGWYVEGSWILTGEAKPYAVSNMNNEIGSWGAPRVSHPFSLKGGSWGAWEFAARYSDTDLNWRENIGGAVNPGVAGGEEKIVTLGLNWYLNNNVRLVLNDMIVKVDRQTAVGVVAGDGSQRGQDLNILGLRMQFQM